MVLVLWHERPAWRCAGCLDRAARTSSFDPTDEMGKESGGDGWVFGPINTAVTRRGANEHTWTSRAAASSLTSICPI